VIRVLALDDPGTVRALVALQRAAYRVEADLIGADVIPGLAETPEQLAASGLEFLGERRTGRMLGAVGYRGTREELEICRLVVHPSAFRRGVARGLLDELEARERDVPRWIVATAAANAPARALYEGRGFEVTGESVVEADVRIVHYAR